MNLTFINRFASCLFAAMDFCFVANYSKHNKFISLTPKSHRHLFLSMCGLLSTPVRKITMTETSACANSPEKNTASPFPLLHVMPKFSSRIFICLAINDLFQEDFTSERCGRNIYLKNHFDICKLYISLF